MVLAMLGWLFVYWLNISNMKKEKAVIIKVQAYDYIKTDINDLIQSCGLLTSHIFLRQQTLENFSEEYPLYELNKKILVEELDKSILKDLYNKTNDNFVKFIFSWELYEIVFKSLVIQRHALQFEFSEINNNYGNLVTDYERFLLFIRDNNEQCNSDTNKELAIRMKEMFERILDFNACIRDVSFNIQDYVFKDIIKDKNDKREVLDKSFLTIDTLIKKHKEKLK